MKFNTENQQHRTAIHEAGHLLIAELAGVWAIAKVFTDGGGATYSPIGKLTQRCRIDLAIAGEVAEELFLAGFRADRALDNFLTYFGDIEDGNTSATDLDQSRGWKESHVQRVIRKITNNKDRHTEIAEELLATGKSESRGKKHREMLQRTLGAMGI